jgi:CheY-like chemotaxis protein
MQATSKRVLVVEDNLDTLRSMTLLLRESGHSVEYAINGYAALETARRFKPQVVLLDLGLPGMDGFELCRRLKSEADLRHCRVVAVTGYAQDDYRERSKQAGCELHLVKPVDPQVLLSVLEK